MHENYRLGRNLERNFNHFFYWRYGGLVMAKRKVKNLSWQNKCLGEYNGRARLTESQVREIRKKYIPYKNGWKKLAQEYGVSRSCIQGVVTRRTWYWLND